jgi:hypothetical protein
VILINTSVPLQTKIVLAKSNHRPFICPVQIGGSFFRKENTFKDNTDKYIKKCMLNQTHKLSLYVAMHISDSMVFDNGLVNTT